MSEDNPKDDVKNSPAKPEWIAAFKNIQDKAAAAGLQEPDWELLAEIEGCSIEEAKQKHKRGDIKP
jgi:hypothetical protein